MRTVRFARGRAVVAASGTIVALALLFAPTTDAFAAAPSTITVHPGDDVNAAIAGARPGDTVSLQPGTYRGPIRVDKSLTLESLQATVVASPRGSALIVTADNVTINAVGATCNGAAGDTRGIDVTGRHVRVVDSSVLQCARGILLDGAQDAYLQGNALLGNHSATGPSAGVWATGADGLTMFGNTFQDDDSGVVIEHTAAPVLDSSTFSQTGTAVSLLSSTDSVVTGTLVSGLTGPAVLVSGTRGAEIARLGSEAGGGGSGPAVELSATAGPSSVVDVEDSNLAHFGVGVRILAGSISDAVTVIGTSFDGVMKAAVDVDAHSGGTVNATIGDYFGGCGPRAPDHGYDGGGALVTDPDRIVSYQVPNCRAPAPAGSGTPAPDATSTGSAAPSAGAQHSSQPTPAAASPDDGNDGASGIPAAIGSALVTVGVAALLAACAGGVLFAIRRSRNVH
ncbi:right-handed parallel beta-helix repeat-containing protein [Rathayibacter sp. CAU 1779]